MADLYLSDSVFAQYVAEYGDDAKAEIRAVVEANAPGGDNA